MEQLGVTFPPKFVPKFAQRPPLPRLWPGAQVKQAVLRRSSGDSIVSRQWKSQPQFLAGTWEAYRSPPCEVPARG